MRIVLVNPCADQHYQTHRHGVGHLGLGYIAACLLREGHDVRVVDAKTCSLSPTRSLERICDYEPQLVGATAMTHEIWHVGWLLAGVKAAMPDCVTMVGGPHSTALPQRTLEEFPGIDIAVQGEGEQTTCVLAEHLESRGAAADLADIEGIASRTGDDIIVTPNRPTLQDLDALPFPAWHLFPRLARWPIYAGRGCPFQCSFCQRVLGERIRLRSVDNVLAEIDALEAHTGQPSSWFQDETFGVDKRWTHEFLDRLIERARTRGYPWRWKANSRANLADRDLYRKMREAGCTMLDFGVESGDRATLKRIHKSITPEQARSALRAARSAGLKTNAFFIIGHPNETWGSALRTVRLAARLGADDIAVGVMVPYPGTEIWELAQHGREGYQLLSEDWRLYDKYFGNALALEGLSHRQLELLQSLTYLAFYLGHGKLWRLIRFVYQFRREAWRMLGRLLPTRRRSGSSARATDPREEADSPEETASTQATKAKPA
jgi:anaerobic magnesium-protoporphyrin IX monomethyl ester cyclase